MATLKKGLDITGPLGNLSIYEMRGVDKKIVRQKGGADRSDILHGENFANTRRHHKEFSAVARAAQHVRWTFHTLRDLSGGFNFSGPINALIRLVQKQDAVSEWGTRNIVLSRHPDVLRGFPLNKANLFDSIVRTTLDWSLDRSTRSACVAIPALMRGINFLPQDDHALFRFEISLGMAPDFRYDHIRKEHLPPAWYGGLHNGTGTRRAATPWYAAKQGCPSSALEITLNRATEDEAYTLILAIGIRFGALFGDSIVKDVRYAGAAKILAVAGAEATPA
ncbi:hypothetical protein [Dawidia soli]|uniref:Uncharacterized protein n=1 Tax=Dawidia soli TaxID=2782352 RepID=A0AAP2DEY7_9BACT|nr:hypothetical protein [Dawidia soli]MBT1690824.1 hypothetical protein [Dawidia soli]